MKFEITKSWQPRKSFRAEAVRGTFSLTAEKFSKNFEGEIPIEETDWQIGCIVGRSGTGKTSIAKELFKDAYYEPKHNPAEIIVDEFPKSMSPQNITKLLGSVGFSSPPDWLKSYEYLSQGEKMRVDVALALADPKPLIVFDEFTSVVDREIAKISCAAISKAIRADVGKKFVAVSCHYDIIPWLDPDWVFHTDEMRFERRNLSGGQPSSWQSTVLAQDSGGSLGRITI